MPDQPVHATLRAAAEPGAALALPTRDKIAFQALLFANAGDDSEDAAALRSNRDRAAALDIDLPEGPRIRRDSAAEHLDSHRPREVAPSLEDGTGEVLSDTGWCFK
ncbi:hypothetical protein AB0C21_42740 [Spirillospora sp. NPDC049024]